MLATNRAKINQAKAFIWHRVLVTDLEVKHNVVSLVAMVTNNKTDLSDSVYQNYHRNMMECDTDESHFLNLESEDLDRLESLADSYFSTRENEEETSDSDSDSSSGDNIQW